MIGVTMALKHKTQKVHVSVWYLGFRDSETPIETPNSRRNICRHTHKNDPQFMETATYLSLKGFPASTPLGRILEEGRASRIAAGAVISSLWSQYPWASGSNYKDLTYFEAYKYVNRTYFWGYLKHQQYQSNGCSSPPSSSRPPKYPVSDLSG